MYAEDSLGITKSIPTGTVGAIGELEVAADLMKMGKHVFRALSPSCPSDLAIIQDGNLLTVEVRTGRRLRSGKLMYADQRMRSDILAVIVHGEDKIHYTPPF